MHNGGFPSNWATLQKVFGLSLLSSELRYEQLCACRPCHRPPTLGPDSSCMHTLCGSGRPISAICTVGTAQKTLSLLHWNVGPAPEYRFWAPCAFMYKLMQWFCPKCPQTPRLLSVSQPCHKLLSLEFIFVVVQGGDRGHLPWMTTWCSWLLLGWGSSELWTLRDPEWTC